MVTGLVDTSIVIDVVRRYPPAMTWYTGQLNLGYSTLVWFEIAQGARSKVTQHDAFKVIANLDEIELIPDDIAWAKAHLPKIALSHNVGTIDCLIAASAARLNIPLYTMNLKHFSPLLGTLAIKPY